MNENRAGGSGSIEFDPAKMHPVHAEEVTAHGPCERLSTPGKTFQNKDIPLQLTWWYYGIL